MTPHEIKEQVDRLARDASWPDCPNGGWQYPFDFGFGIEAPTYTPTQRELHPWRRAVTLSALDRYFEGRYDRISVLDLGAGECAFAAGLWEKGVRDITCVEARDINIDKALFVQNVLGCEFKIVKEDVNKFLENDERTYDLVLFMGLLYHLQDPFNVTRKIAEKTKEISVIETVLACPSEVVFSNNSDYRPKSAAYYIRIENKDGPTAGLSDIELWPTQSALDYTLYNAGFKRLEDIVPEDASINFYSTKQRTLLLAHK
ncbi:methyltransferase domain-containing protein [Methylococcaceae bacterium WWC4]|nr:methyltransferase domain-containing protein [Methylococcaceae bacterium WWC4]